MRRMLREPIAPCLAVLGVGDGATAPSSGLPKATRSSARSKSSKRATKTRSWRSLGPTTSATRSCAERIPVSTSGCLAQGTKIAIPTPLRAAACSAARYRRQRRRAAPVLLPGGSGPLPDGVAPGSPRVITHPISIGRMDWSTPLGVTTITGKVANPSWYPPQSIRDEHAARNDILPRVVPPGPDNPLGKHALRLGLPGYLIHGTNKPSGVGMRVTHGCIRMFPEDIEALYQDGADRHGGQHRQSASENWLDGRRHVVSRGASGFAMESNVDGESAVALDPPSSSSRLKSRRSRASCVRTSRRPMRADVDLDWDSAERVGASR